MLTFLVPLASAVGGVLAGLLPALLVSQRRRLLKLIEDEDRTLNSITDPVAKAQFARAIRSTVRRYQHLAAMSRGDQARNRFLVVLPIAYTVGIFGAFTMLMPERLADSNHAQGIWGAVGLAATIASLLSLTIGLVTLLEARRQDNSESKRLQIERRRRERAESAVDEVEQRLRDVSPLHSAILADDLKALRSRLQRLQEERDETPSRGKRSKGQLKLALDFKTGQFHPVRETEKPDADRPGAEEPRN